MTQARLMLGASSRVLERSSTARRFNHRQRLLVDLGSPALYHSVNSTNFRCRGGASTSSLHHVSSTFFLPSSPYARTLSTNVPPTSTPTKSKDSLPPSSASTVGGKSKPKIELRPGPAKPSTKSSSHPQPTQTQKTSSASKPHPTKPPPLLAASTKEDVLKETEGAGLVEIAKKDIDDAARHGILSPPPPDAGMVRRLVHQAKELFKFYLFGMKYIVTNRLEVRKIKARVAGGGAPLTWKELRFILTNNSDIAKLVPFVLTILVIEEIIPLIVMYVPGMLPSTCILPSQRERIEAKRHERQREVYTSARDTGHFSSTNVEGVQLKAFDDYEIKLLCSTAGISTFGYFGMQRRRLAKYLRSMAEEDSLLLAEGKGARLNKEEIANALWERGFLADSYTPVQQRDRLRWWLEKVKSSTANATDTSPEDVRVQLFVLMHRESRS